MGLVNKFSSFKQLLETIDNDILNIQDVLLEYEDDGIIKETSVSIVNRNFNLIRVFLKFNTTHSLYTENLEDFNDGRELDNPVKNFLYQGKLYDYLSDVKDKIINKTTLNNKYQLHDVITFQCARLEFRISH